MSAGALLLTLAGLLVAAGLVGVVLSARGISLLGQGASRGRRSARWGRRHTIAVMVGLLVLLVTRWPVAAVAAAGAAWVIPALFGGAEESRRRIERAEALASWTRRMADLLTAGAAGSTREAISRSVSAAPPVISAELARLGTRMGPQGVERALRLFAAEIADPVADKVVGVLILRERNGGPGLADVLTALASDLDYEVRMLREVEAERAKPRGNMKTILIVTGLAVGGMLLLMRPFLSVYSSVIGQVLLLVVVGVFALALRWMRQLSRPPAVERILVDPPGTVTA